MPEVILIEDVKGLGSEGAVLKVARGYARNFLFPRKLAAPVTEMNHRQLKKKQADRALHDKQTLENTKVLAEKIEKVSCTLPVKTGEQGKMYGSVSGTDILKALKGQGIDLEKNQLILAEPIRELGVFKIPIKLYEDVQSTLNVWIVEE
ncbi:MAG: 50S ribosomal protein L9 [Kiritimatiellae bacterium]|nr:50S ribosomal protein L9 [Kiritimatiellia bacterium]